VRDLASEIAGDFGIEKSELAKYDMQKCTVLCLATASQLGEQNFEYYDIAFDDGSVMEAISGYHLQVGNPGSVIGAR